MTYMLAKKIISPPKWQNGFGEFQDLLNFLFFGFAFQNGVRRDI